MRRLVASALMLLAGCAGASPPDLPRAANVDLPRFMGRWYVIAHIPSYPEREAYAAVETYTLRPDGRIQTQYRQNTGAFDGKVDTMKPVGSVVPDTGNAVWGMQFVWPIQAEYVIGWVAPDYSQTLVVRSKRDYAWVMARTPTIPDADYRAAVERLRAMGYDVAKLRRVPQRP